MSLATSASLERCVGDVDRFLKESWSTSPYLHKRVGSDVFSDLLSLAQADHILSTMALRAPAFRLVKEGKALPPSSYLRAGRMGSRTLTDLADMARVYEHFHAGATIVLQGLQRWWAPLACFCRELELSLTHPVQANAYITPPGSQGLAIHRDAHDVFALQTYGHKRWVTYESVPARPEPAQPPSAGEPTLDLYLHPGDCLYVPRGAFHAAATVDAASIHITVGVLSITWKDVFTRLLSDVESFDEALPAGFAHDPQGTATAVADQLRKLSEWTAGSDPRALAAGEQRRFWASRPPVYTDQLRQLLALDGVDDDTEVERHPLAICELIPAGNRLQVVLGDRRILMPAHAEPAMRAILERGRLRVRDLAGYLDSDGRRILVRRLVREGLLRIRDRGGGSGT